MLEVKSLVAGYNNVPILAGVDLKVGDHQIVAIVGPNGAGKSTLLKAITGLIRPMKGQVLFDSQDVTGRAPHNILRAGIAMVPEGRQLFPSLTVLENLEVGSIVPKNRAKRKENLEKVCGLFPKLAERSKQLAGTLSGGEQQMVATARALMSDPQLLILDEPSWGLAPLLADEMLQALKRIRDEDNISILIVEQNVGKTLLMSDYGYVIEQGIVVMKGRGIELLNDENLKKAYLGI